MTRRQLSLAAALALLALPIADITDFVLREVAQRVAGSAPHGIPLFSFRHGHAVVRREHATREGRR